MEKKSMHRIGMRKIKSLLAMAIAFTLWQIVRIFLPQLETHPIFAYVYAIIEMRDTSEKSKSFSFLRIKATFVGLVVGLIFISFSIWLTGLTAVLWQKILIDFILILMATLLALCLAEMFQCKNFCGLAAAIAVICMVSHSGEDRYLYAVMRSLQTLLGVFSAVFINAYLLPYPKKAAASLADCEKKESSS